MIRIVKYIENIVWRYYFFSSDAIISRKIKRIKGNKTSCDLGCGEGEMMSRLNYFKTGLDPTLGIDIHLPTLKVARDKNLYRWVICADLRNLPLKEGVFDVAIASHVIEHIEKEEKLFNSLERVCKKLLIVGVPRGITKFSPHEEKEENIYQRHKSGYEIEDFRRLGFKVYGFGARFICNSFYKEGKIPTFFRPVFSFSSQLFTVFTYLLPGIADCLICVKYKASKNLKEDEKQIN